MQIVIDIPKDIIYDIKESYMGEDVLYCGVKYGTPLKTGHWIYELEDWNKWTCSECSWHKRTDIHIKLGYKYCPNCGARMESEDKE